MYEKAPYIHPDRNKHKSMQVPLMLGINTEGFHLGNLTPELSPIQKDGN